MYLEKNGQYRTDSLFVERISTRHKDMGHIPIYSLSERIDKKNYIRLYEVFINSIDEYDFAIKAFGAKAHLDKLKNTKWFSQGWPGCLTFRGYNVWLDDMAERDSSVGKQILMQKAKEGNVSAARKLVDMNKQADTEKGAGRPKKEDIKRESIRLAEENNDINNDLQRLSSAKVIKLRG